MIESDLFETSEPDRVILELYILKSSDYKSSITDENNQKIIEFLSKRKSAKRSEISEAIGLGESRTRDYLKLLVENGVVIAEGENNNRVYRLSGEN